MSVFLVADYFVVIVIYVVVADYFNIVIVVVFYVVAWFDFADQSICSAQTFLLIIFRKGWYFSLLNFSLNLSLHLFFLPPTYTHRTTNASVRSVGLDATATKTLTSALTFLPTLAKTAPPVSTQGATTPACVQEDTRDANASTTSTTAHPSARV